MMQGMQRRPPSIKAFIQARMSSKRLPGKVMLPLHGELVISRVLTQVEKAVPKQDIVVATSTDQSDDSLVSYLLDRNTNVFRGPLDNVFARFQNCLKEYPCDWFFRVCADSPLLNPAVLTYFLHLVDTTEADIITTLFPRSFPAGQSVELVRARTFRTLMTDKLSAEEQEHLTKAYYANPHRFRIKNVSSGNASLAEINYCVDTAEDMARLEQFLAGGAVFPDVAFKS